MTYETQIQNLRQKQYDCRSNDEFEKIEKQILKLAKKYNSLDYRKKYTIIDGKVYSLNIRRL